MKTVLLALLSWLPLQPIFADVAPVSIYGPILLVLAVPVLIVVVAVVLYKVIKNKKK